MSTSKCPTENLAGDLRYITHARFWVDDNCQGSSTWGEDDCESVGGWFGSNFNNSVTTVCVAPGYGIRLFDDEKYGGKMKEIVGTGTKVTCKSLKGDDFENKMSSFVANRVSSSGCPTSASNSFEPDEYARVFDGENCSGVYTSVKPLAYEANLPKIESVQDTLPGFNNSISYICVPKGYRVKIFKDISFTGDRKIIDAKDNSVCLDFKGSSSLSGLDNAVSSIYAQKISENPSCPTAPGAEVLQLFEDEKCGGDSISTSYSTDNITRTFGGYHNNTISTVCVQKGYKVTLYDDPKFGGNSHTIEAKNAFTCQSLSSTALDNKASSWSLVPLAGDCKNWSAEEVDVSLKASTFAYDLPQEWFKDEASEWENPDHYKKMWNAEDNASDGEKIMADIAFDDTFWLAELYKKHDCTGRTLGIDVKEVPSLKDSFLSETYAKKFYQDTDAICIRGGYEAELFKKEDFKGKSIKLTGGKCYNLTKDPTKFSSDISSIKIKQTSSQMDEDVNLADDPDLGAEGYVPLDDAYELAIELEVFEDGDGSSAVHAAADNLAIEDA